MASVSETKLLPARPYSHAARWNTDSWAWEIVFCILSIIATVTVAVLVFIYDDKPFPTLPYQIGLNSVIAIVGTVSKSALLLTITSCISQYKWVNFDDVFENSPLQNLQLHDEASRGPWGSFMLLVKWKGLYWVKVGALATVLSLAFDPVYQALIKIEQRPKYHDYPVAVAKRALNFGDFSDYEKIYGDGYFSIDWYHGITNAILNSTSVLETTPSCPTGNCTFPVFSSLGLCFNCIDIAQSLQQSSNCTQTEGRELDVLEQCNYSLPLFSSGSNYYRFHESEYEPFNLNWSLFKEEHQRLYESYDFAEGPVFLTRFLSKGQIEEGEIHLPDGKVIPNSFTPLALIKVAPKMGSSSTIFFDTANICALSICAREYNLSMTSGLLRSEIISTSYSKAIRHSVNPYNDSVSYSFAFSNSVNNINVSVDPWGGPTHNPRLDIEYYLTQALKQLFEGELSVDFDSFTDGFSSNSASNILQYGLNASIDISKTMDRIAEVMTNRLRDISNHTIQGQSGSMELYIRISWWWLLLPVLCVIFEMVVLISVMIITRKHKLLIWKTSELALLFHGFDFSIGNTVETQKASEMETIASALQIRLKRGSKETLKLERKSE